MAAIWSYHPVGAPAAAVWIQVGLGMWLLAAARGDCSVWPAWPALPGAWPAGPRFLAVRPPGLACERGRRRARLFLTRLPGAPQVDASLDGVSVNVGELIGSEIEVVESSYVLLSWATLLAPINTK